MLIHLFPPSDPIDKLNISVSSPAMCVSLRNAASCGREPTRKSPLDETGSSRKTDRALEIVAVDSSDDSDEESFIPVRLNIEAK